MELLGAVERSVSVVGNVLTFDVSKASIILQWTSHFRPHPHSSVFMWDDSTIWQDQILSPQLTAVLFWLFGNMFLFLQWSQEQSEMLILQCVCFQTGHFFGSLFQLLQSDWIVLSKQREIKSQLGVISAAGISSWALPYCLADCSLNCWNAEKLLSPGSPVNWDERTSVLPDTEWLVSTQPQNAPFLDVTLLRVWLGDIVTFILFP